MATQKKVTRKPTHSARSRSVAPKPTKRTVIATELAPQAIGPYSQAIRAGNFIFTAGQIPIDPLINQMIEGDIAAQTRRVLLNIRAILEALADGLVEDPQTVQRYLNTAQQDVRALSGLIDDLRIYNRALSKAEINYLFNGGDTTLTIEVSQVRICWNPPPLKTSQLQYRSSLTSGEWVNLGDPILESNTQICVTNDVAGPPRFYRVLYLP